MSNKKSKNIQLKNNEGYGIITDKIKSANNYLKKQKFLNKFDNLIGSKNRENLLNLIPAYGSQINKAYTFAKN